MDNINNMTNIGSNCRKINENSIKFPRMSSSVSIDKKKKLKILLKWDINDIFIHQHNMRNKI